MQAPEKTSPSANPSSRWLRLLASGFFALAAVYHLALAAKGMSAFRDQHIGAALEFARGRIDLLNPIIVGFNAGGTPTILELPLWQAVAAVFFKLFGTWFGWANLTSLLFLAAALWPLWQLARTHLGERGARWAMVFFLAQPLIFYTAGRAGADGCSLTMAVWFMYCADRLLHTAAWRWWLGAAVFGALSALTKVPFFFCGGVAAFFLLLAHHRRDVRRWIMLASVGAVAAVVFMAWTRHTDACAARAEFPFMDLRLSGKTEGVSMMWWYFGDWHYRLNPANWGKGAWRFLNVQFGSFALCGLLFLGLAGLRAGLVQFWFAAAAVTTLVFSHLVLHHSHYYLLFSPATAMLCAAGMTQLETWLVAGPRPRLRAALVPLATAAALGLALVQGLIAMHTVLDRDAYPGKMAALIRAHTSPADKLLIQGGGWGGEQLILSDRHGLSIWNTRIVEDPVRFARLRELGYTKLVLLSESPLLTALRQSNSARGEAQRTTYRPHVTPQVAAWKTLLETEDILIKELPAAPPPAK